MRFHLVVLKTNDNNHYYIPQKFDPLTIKTEMALSLICNVEKLFIYFPTLGPNDKI